MWKARKGYDLFLSEQIPRGQSKVEYSCQVSATIDNLKHFPLFLHVNKGKHWLPFTYLHLINKMTSYSESSYTIQNLYLHLKCYRGVSYINFFKDSLCTILPNFTILFFNWMNVTLSFIWKVMHDAERRDRLTDVTDLRSNQPLG